MAQVIAARLHLSVWILLSACAPSLPHPPETRAPADAAIDQPSPIPEAPSAAPRDAAIKDSAAIPDALIRDAAAEAGLARDSRLADARESRSSDASADTDADVDQKADTGADTGANADEKADETAVPSPHPGDLRITELLINPAGTDTNREWIEVVNLAAHPVDLHLLTVADAASEVAVDAGLLDPGGILVLGQSLDPARNGGAPVGFSFGNVISLNNGGDLIRLCLDSCAGGVILAEVSWAADLGPAFDGHAAVVGISGAPAGDGDGGDAGGGDAGGGDAGGGDGGGAADGGPAAAPDFCAADQPFGTAGSFGRPGLPDPPCPG